MDQLDTEIIDLTGLSLASSNSSTREMSIEMSEHASTPWYQDPHASHPFSLSVRCRAPRASVSPFTGVEFFPWGNTPLEHLWNDESSTTEENSQSSWQTIRSKWKNVAAVCGGCVVRLINVSSQQQGAPVFQISLPDDCPFSVSHAKWALDPRNLHPLIIYTHSSVLHIFDVEMRNFLGCIRGHGADITSLGVHPLHPHIVFTTSRDFTTRIYDLRVVSSPGVSQGSSQNRRKSAFGRAETDDGNSHIGKCVVVLTGGRSGGHEAAVLGADFHPSLPLIATCGMDHAVRIWYLKPQLFIREKQPTEEADALYREDKPLFSSSFIHDARVHSVHWLSFDLLVSHSAPPLRTAQVAGSSGSGTLAVWKWLSIGRFFPPHTPIYREPPLRGCISVSQVGVSDPAANGSNRIIAKAMISLSELPMDASRMSLHRQRHRPPLILFTVRSKVMLLNASQLPPRNRPVLQDDRDRGEAPQSKRIRLSGAMAENTYTDVEGWTLSVALGEDLEDEELEQCVLSPDGQRVAAVGSREGVWIWNAT